MDLPFMLIDKTPSDLRELLLHDDCEAKLN